MNLGRRILRLAKHRVLDGLRGRGSRPADPAREELDGYLRESPASGIPPHSRSRPTARPSAASSAGAGNRASGARSNPGPGNPGAGKSHANPGPKPPPPPPPHPHAAEYRLLGVAVGADLAAVRAAWRARVKENHPDRFAGDADAQRRAADRLRAINQAHDALRRHLERA